MIYLHNTLTRKKEAFNPITQGEVKMYNCGPTIYNYVHIGNLRSNIFADVLRRMFEYNDYKVTQVVNITDIGHLKSDADEGEDKMTTALKKAGKPLTLESLHELASFYTEAFVQNLSSLNIQRPTFMPLASEHITEDIGLIKKLEEKGFIYSTSDGVYFDTSKDPEYGKLGGINAHPEETESRIGINAEKKNPHDFALWKFNSESLGWDTPWGKGFPGWHIECSAMAMQYLGESFDVHTGGIDHISIHHNNEIAQSESATGKLFARYWLHNAFININNEKISKSLGNDIYLQNIIERGFSPLAYRYLLLGAHYQTPMNFNWDALEGADTALKRLTSHISRLSEETKQLENGESVEINKIYKEKFTKYINDDLDTPKALALVWEILNNDEINAQEKKATILDFDKVLGLNIEELSQTVHLKIPEEVSLLIELREIARQNKDWEKADELRKNILESGFVVKDTETGPLVSTVFSS